MLTMAKGFLSPLNLFANFKSVARCRKVSQTSNSGQVLDRKSKFGKCRLSQVSQVWGAVKSRHRVGPPRGPYICNVPPFGSCRGDLTGHTENLIWERARPAGRKVAFHTLCRMNALCAAA